MRPIAYVAGPYSGKDRDKFVAEANEVGKALMLLGYAPFVPHKNSLNWENELGKTVDTDEFLDVDFAILEKCNILVLFGDWKKSYGATQEVEFAKSNGIEVYGDITIVPPAEHLALNAQTEVISDAYKRRRLGQERYGELLTKNNNGEALQNAYEEVLDLANYLKWHMMTRGQTGPFEC